MKDLILIGKQGSGKGTQGKILTQKIPFTIFETGSELRKIAAEDSELGKMVKNITDRGDLVPNELVMKIVENFVQKADKDTPIIFDGIPRSQEQRISLEQSLENVGRSFYALEIKLSEEEAMKRLLSRANCNDCGENFGGNICPKCGSKNLSRRSDDNEESIRKRLENFETFTKPLLVNWEEREKLLSVDGEQASKDVAKDILEKIQQL